MRAIIIDSYGGIEQLKEREVETPTINENQVLVEVHATSINPIDWKLREGYLKEMLPWEFPIILGWDAAGVVAKIGTNVKHFKVGDRVFTRPATTRQGTYAEFVPVEEQLLAHMPESMTFEEGAAIPLAGLTAYQCLVDFAEVKKGDKVLIHAGAGGVGSMAIQIANSIGAYVATTASDKNDELVKSLGANRVINYSEEDFSELLENFDAVLDTMGGEVLDKSFKVLKKGGKLISIAGQPSAEKAQEHEVKASSFWLEPSGEQLHQLANLFVSGEFKPAIGHVFDFSEQGLKDAHELSETHHARGKIIIKVKS
ncbi:MULTISPECIES: NADP-dependent oxidoreductase [Planococcus]|uniref:NADPH:quinone reductase n=1 Tax=Planococcus faecalis TaxID=1598147 RepID=A0ABM6IQV3_9BACL|nr:MULTISPECIES: NADP-dependent oxidoreductase [Planococcus]AQU78961.1 NADPH:quinone reductase [Planococcus faecalis]MDJ0330900.1 NADP-dependent oxidoreductase [Planococcus sp. S3-L1]OHX54707.1 NADPH:quinone reductase [Planococcus faecalis]